MSSITRPSTGGGGSPTDAEYVTLAANPDLTAERILAEALGVSLTDGGAGNQLTVGVDQAAAPTWTGQHTATPETLTEVGSVAIDRARGIAMQGGYMYVSSFDDDQIRVFDLSDPTNPSLVDQITSASLDAPFGLDAQGAYLYASSRGTNQLVIIDISDPNAPTIESTLTGTLTGLNNVRVAGDIAYCCAGTDNALTLVDVRDPASPREVGTVTSAELTTPRSVVVQGGYAFVGAEQYLVIIDVSDPTTPTQVGSTLHGNAGANAWSLDLQDNIVYIIGDGDDSLRAIDVSDPNNPSNLDQLIDAVDLNGPRSIVAAGDYAYIACHGGSTLTIVDISDPTNLSILATHQGSVSSPFAVEVADGLLAITDDSVPGQATLIDLSAWHLANARIGTLATRRLGATQALIERLTATTGIHAGPAGIHTQGPLSSGQGLAVRDLAVAAARRVTANTTLTNDDHLVVADASGGTFTVTLPADPDPGRTIAIKCIDPGTNQVNVARNGNTIDEDAVDQVLDTDNEAILLQFFTGQGWYIIDHGTPPP